MSKKDYVLLAGVVSSCLTNDHAELRMKERIVMTLCKALKEDNPAFDPAKFILACRL